MERLNIGLRAGDLSVHMAGDKSNRCRLTACLINGLTYKPTEVIRAIYSIAVPLQLPTLTDQRSLPPSERYQG